MTRHFSVRLACSTLAVFALLTGCAEQEEAGPGFVMVDPPSTVIPAGDGEPGSDALACQPADLCTMTIDDCGIEMTHDQCEAWYAEPANCADMDAYLECNCECLTEAVCDDYFSCGEICFADLC